MRALVIDDEEFFRGYVEELLQESGYEVMTAKNGIEGVRMFRTYEFDLVITDIIMPGKEGLQTIREIREENPDTPIIAVSGYHGNTGDEYMKYALEFGANRTFRKPFESKEFLEEAERLTSTPH